MKLLLTILAACLALCSAANQCNDCISDKMCWVNGKCVAEFVVRAKKLNRAEVCTTTACPDDSGDGDTVNEAPRLASRRPSVPTKNSGSDSDSDGGNEVELDAATKEKIRQALADGKGVILEVPEANKFVLNVVDDVDNNAEHKHGQALDKQQTRAFNSFTEKLKGQTVSTLAAIGVWHKSDDMERNRSPLKKGIAIIEAIPQTMTMKAKMAMSSKQQAVIFLNSITGAKHKTNWNLDDDPPTYETMKKHIFQLGKVTAAYDAGERDAAYARLNGNDELAKQEERQNERLKASAKRRPSGPSHAPGLVHELKTVQKKMGLRSGDDD